MKKFLFRYILSALLTLICLNTFLIQLYSQETENINAQHREYLYKQIGKIKSVKDNLRSKRDEANKILKTIESFTINHDGDFLLVLNFLTLGDPEIIDGEEREARLRPLEDNFPVVTKILKYDKFNAGLVLSSTTIKHIHPFEADNNIAYILSESLGTPKALKKLIEYYKNENIISESQAKLLSSIKRILDGVMKYNGGFNKEYEGFLFLQKNGHETSPISTLNIESTQVSTESTKSNSHQKQPPGPKLKSKYVK